MNAFGNIEYLAGHLASKIEALINERDNMLIEIINLRENLAKRDKEAVKIVQDMRTELEAAQAEALRFEQEQVKINMKLQNMNNKLIGMTTELKRYPEIRTEKHLEDGSFG